MAFGAGTVELGDVAIGAGWRPAGADTTTTSSDTSTSAPGVTTTTAPPATTTTTLSPPYNGPPPAVPTQGVQFGVHVETVGSRFGGIPSGLPHVAIPAIRWSLVPTLAMPGAPIARS